MRIYAIGDVHGQLDMLRGVHDLIERDGGAGAQVVHVGDLIDRGPDSAVRLDDDGVWLLTDRGPKRVEPPKHA